jgi:HPt (histidine-containing phosphotransfer) domain-containing protein
MKVNSQLFHRYMPRPMPDTPPTQSQPLATALSRMWDRFLPEINARIAILEEAAAGNPLSQEQRAAGHAAAHKLAGSLGMFGLQRGTELARQIELALAESPVSATQAELAASAAELRTLVLNRS